jgi:hypothetical protein
MRWCQARVHPFTLKSNPAQQSYCTRTHSTTYPTNNGKNETDNLASQMNLEPETIRAVLEETSKDGSHGQEPAKSNQHATGVRVILFLQVRTRTGNTIRRSTLHKDDRITKSVDGTSTSSVTAAGSVSIHGIPIGINSSSRNETKRNAELGLPDFRGANGGRDTGRAEINDCGSQTGAHASNQASWIVAGRAGADAARKVNDPFLGSAVQSPSTSVGRFTRQGIQENLKVGSDAPVDIHETVDRVQLGTFERAYALSIQKSTAVDAKLVHDESFDAKLLAHFECSRRTDSVGKKSGDQRDHHSEAKATERTIQGYHGDLI